MIHARRLVIGAVLLALASGSWWLTRNAAQPPGLDPARARNEPDYIIENFVARAMNELGARKYVLSARELRHYPRDDTAHLVEPALVQYLPDGGLVTTRADTGVMPGDGSEILMEGNVRVQRMAGQAAAGGEIQAERMRVELDR